jgi:hypothetical protein
MPRKITIINRTAWRTRDLRAFIVRCARIVFKKDERPLEVRFYARRRGGKSNGRSCSGYAFYNSGVSRIGVPRNCDKIDLAHVLIHEFGHNVGLKHRDMTADPFYLRVGNWRERLAWAESLPLERRSNVVTIKKVLTPQTEVARAIERIEKRIKQLRTKHKRIESEIRKQTQRLARCARKARKIAANLATVTTTPTDSAN